MEIAVKAPKPLLPVDDADRDGPDEEILQDQDLLTAFKHGNRNAFAMLYRRHCRAVFQFAFYMAGSADIADELTQEVFVWLIYHPGAFDPNRGSLPAFLGGVARKFLRRQRRAQSRWTPLEDALQLLQTIGIARSTSFQPDCALDAAQLREAIALLPIRYREVIVVCDLQENDYRETARILGCSVGTVRSRLHRGRDLLARKLNPSREKETLMVCKCAREQIELIFQPEEANAELTNHVRECDSCRGFFEERSLLQAAVAQLRCEVSCTGPSGRVEQHVLAALSDQGVRSHAASKQSRWLIAGTLAAVTVLMVAFLIAQGRSTVRPTQAADEQFTAMPYVIPPAPYERTSVVRTEVPLQIMLSAGFQVEGEDPSASALADVLYGEDGRILALRLVVQPTHFSTTRMY